MTWFQTAKNLKNFKNTLKLYFIYKHVFSLESKVC